MTSFSHDSKGKKLANDLWKKTEQIYQWKMYKPDEKLLNILSDREREAYLMCLEDENRELKKQIWHQVINEP